MQILEQVRALREAVGAWRRGGERIAFVPTMGNLHAGHHSLVALARRHADRVVASVFVNPTQFGPGEDYARYPRTPEDDAAGLAVAGCDALWLPDVATMYPFGPDAAVRIHVPMVSEVLEGAHRPGHFDGVCTVVARLFHQVRPDVAVFGRKDYQQWLVVRRMVEDLAFPVELVAGDIVRESDGLAMSSRNSYLSPEDRARAPELHRVLLRMRAMAQEGAVRAQVETEANAALREAGFVPDYAVIRTADLREPVGELPGPRVALIAARLGKTRLIDNLEFDSALSG